MNNKCVNRGNIIEWCNAMENCFENDFGDFDVGVYSRLSDGEARFFLTAGRFKKNKVELFFCPACGVNIRTKFEG